MTDKEERQFSMESLKNGAFFDVLASLLNQPWAEVNELESWVRRVLAALGHGKAWASDVTRVSEIAVFLDRPGGIDRDGIERAEKSLGVLVSPDDLVIDVARRLKEAEEKGHDKSDG